MNYSVDFAIKEAIATVRNLNKLLQRDFIFLSILFGIIILKSNDSIQFSYVTLDLSERFSKIAIWFIICITLIIIQSHLCKIYVLHRIIDRELKNNAIENLPSTDDDVRKGYIIRVSARESSYLLSDNFISDFIATGSKREASFRRLQFSLMSVLAINCIVSVYYITDILGFELDLFLYALCVLLSIIILTSSLVVIFRYSVYSKTIAEQEKEDWIRFLINARKTIGDFLLLSEDIKLEYKELEKINAMSSILENSRKLINAYDYEFIRKYADIYIDNIKILFKYLEPKMSQLWENKKKAANITPSSDEEAFLMTRDLDRLEEKIGRFKDLINSGPIPFYSSSYVRFLTYNSINYRSNKQLDLKEFLRALILNSN
ncbi:hypothetical protein V6Z05_19470 [Leptospira venezuelensis]|uniref:hypothetical protein n=1 Tax=Leptospira venezuelensis TaxID=1958811 RepID=UPI000A3825DB|nr:hypothetical protein [Leptospira venezuelensis]